MGYIGGVIAVIIAFRVWEDWVFEVGEHFCALFLGAHEEEVAVFEGALSFFEGYAFAFGLVDATVGVEEVSRVFVGGAEGVFLMGFGEAGVDEVGGLVDVAVVSHGAVRVGYDDRGGGKEFEAPRNEEGEGVRRCSFLDAEAVQLEERVLVGFAHGAHDEGRARRDAERAHPHEPRPFVETEGVHGVRQTVGVVLIQEPLPRLLGADGPHGQFRTAILGNGAGTMRHSVGCLLLDRVLSDR